MVSERIIMANSKYEYVRAFEQPDVLLANTWIVVRIDGRGFSKLTAKYKFVKPNDRRALDLMNAAAAAVMKELPDLVLAYGNSDEFSFVFHRDCVLFERRASKLTTTIVSTFTSYYTFLWPTYFPDSPLTPPLPSFDGRAVCYPSDTNLRDYMSWRQVDCHINNLYNTTFWALVQQGGIEPQAAERELSGTVSSDKNEILFSRFGINYNNEPEIFKKGSVLYRDFFPTSTHSPPMSPRAEMANSPPLSYPQPQRPIPRPISQPLECTLPDLLRDSPEDSKVATPRGPTFLSTSTTPSPPPSPPSMSMPTIDNPLPVNPAISYSYPQTFMPVSPPPNGSAPRQPLPMLTPIPLPPPTLKPSTRPPLSLNPPNPTAHTNTSPLPSPNAGPGPIPLRISSTLKSPTKPISHSASASLSRPATTSASATKPSPKRSPSLSILEFGPPQIPLRISSIPMNAAPRKLSLPSQKSYALLKEDENKENAANNTAGIGLASSGGARVSPPAHLRTMKELPSPPVDDAATRSAVMGEEPQQWIPSPPSTGGGVGGPISPPPRSTRRARSHSRLHSAPPTSHIPLPNPLGANPPSSHPQQQQQLASAPFGSIDWHSQPHPQPPPQTSKANTKSKQKARIQEEGGWAASTLSTEGRPIPMSKTQRDKERKKRGKARIVIEHVDLIRDEFWERRPWILSGRAGV